MKLKKLMVMGAMVGGFLARPQRAQAQESQTRPYTDFQTLVRNGDMGTDWNGHFTYKDFRRTLIHEKLLKGDQKPRGDFVIDSITYADPTAEFPKGAHQVHASSAGNGFVMRDIKTFASDDIDHMGDEMISETIIVILTNQYKINNEPLYECAAMQTTADTAGNMTEMKAFSYFTANGQFVENTSILPAEANANRLVTFKSSEKIITGVMNQMRRLGANNGMTPLIAKHVHELEQNIGLQLQIDARNTAPQPH